MKVVVAGGTGFLGGSLVDALVARGDDVVVLTRGAATGRQVTWTPDGTSGPWARALEGAHAVVNLTGEPLPAKRWSEAQKQRLIDSRVKPTQSLVAAIDAMETPPAALLNASGIGAYPDSDAVVDERSAPGSDFLSRMSIAWEDAARAVTRRDGAPRVVLLRSGVVLHRDGGALEQLVPPFRFGAGGPLGSGRQYWPWIHRDDWVRMVIWAIDTPHVDGPLNVCAPDSIPQREIARAIGRALHRPALVPAPWLALRLLLGEMADAMLLSSQRVVPRAALDGGFTWRYPTIDAAIGAELG